MDPSSTTAQLCYAKETLVASVVELAEAFHVSRRSIYDCLNGTADIEEGAERINELAVAALTIEAAGFARDRHLLRRRIVDGKTLLEVLSLGEPLQPATQNLISILQREEVERDRVAALFANRAPTPPSADFDFP